MTQLGNDKVKTKISKNKDGSPLTSNGSAVVSEIVTNVLGNASYDINIRRKSAKNINGILLVSDGVYNCTSSFDFDILKLFDTINITGAQKGLITTYANHQTDDMSMLAIRRLRDDFDTKTIVNGALKGKRDLSRSNFEVNRSFLIEFENSIRYKENSRARKISEYIDKKEIDLGKENITGLISLMVQTDFQDRGIYHDLMKKAGRSLG